MVVDEPAMWSLIPDRLKPRVDAAAKALCRSRDTDDDDWHEGEGRDDCRGCDTPEGGSCVAFGLWGQMAIDVVEALDKLDREGASAT